EESSEQMGQITNSRYLGWGGGLAQQAAYRRTDRKTGEDGKAFNTATTEQHTCMHPYIMRLEAESAILVRYKKPELVKSYTEFSVRKCTYAGKAYEKRAKPWESAS
ncbi:hypothetical protein J6590_096730, partial [Homalodisca vitripennis]